MSLVNTLGSFPPGVVYAPGPGDFASVAAPSAGQYLASKGANNYVFTKNFAASSISYGVINASFVSLTGGSPTPVIASVPVGDNSSNYDLTAQVLTTTWGVASTLGTYNMQTSVTCGNSNSIAYLNIYFDPAIIPSPESSGNSIKTGYTPGAITAPVATSIGFGGIGFVLPLVTSVCAFKNASGAVNAGYPGDFILIEELVPLGSTLVQTATCTSTSSAPVALFSLSTGASDNFFVTGSVVFGDTAFVVSNSQTFMFMLQQGASGNAVLTVGPSSSLAPAPYLQYSLVGSTLTVNVVGINSVTFDCKATFIIIEGNAGI